MFVLSGSWFLHVVILLATVASLGDAYKYFNEPRGRNLHHYDARFYRGRVSAEKRAETLSELIVAFLEIMDSEGIVTWLAHGTLMGWYWNGHSLPWDWDVDMQIDVTSLLTLAEDYNSTVWTAIPSNAGTDAEPRDYFLDVNPFWTERVHGDGMNFIDARFIDTRNGLFVDITALTELDPVKRPDIVSCKNYHNYRLDDIYPLRESVFEGTKAKLPFNYKTILAEEYGQRSLVLAHYNGYIWRKATSEWIPKANAKPPYRLNGIPSTPPTRIIPDEELAYYDKPPSSDENLPSPANIKPPTVSNPHDSMPVPTTLISVLKIASPTLSASPIPIKIEELPADRIDSPQMGSKGSIFSTIWEYLTLYW